MQGTNSPQPAPHGARAQKACVLRLLSRGGERKRACAPRETRVAGIALEHQGNLSKGKGFSPERCPSIKDEPAAASAARHARAASSCAARSTLRQRAPARLRRVTCGAGLAFEAVAGMSHHGLARKERGPFPAQCSFAVNGRTRITVTRRARAESFRAGPPPQRRRTQARLCAVRNTRRWLIFLLEAAASTPHRDHVPNGRAFLPA